MKTVIALALFAAAMMFVSHSYADMKTIWINGEPIMINQIGNSTTIMDNNGMTICNTTGNMTNCW